MRPKPFSIGRIRVRALRTRKDGRWYWRAQLYSGGRESTVWTGWGTPDEAAKEVAKVLIAPESPSFAEHGYPGIDTVRDLLETWVGSLEDRADLTPATRTIYQLAAKRLVRTQLQHVPLARVSLTTLEHWRSESLRLSSSATTELDQRILRIAWKWGLALGLVSRDIPRVRVKVTPTMSRHVPSPGDVAAVVRELNERNALLVRLLWETGCRRSEIGDLTWSQIIDTTDGTWLEVTGKTGPRRVPISRATRRLLGERGSELFGSHFHLSARIKTACKRAGVPHFTPKSLRTAACNRLYRSGVDVGTAGALLGHSPTTALRYYRAATESDLLDAATLLQGLPAGEVIQLRAGAPAQPPAQDDPEPSE